MSFKGKVAIVTGSTGGIGREIAEGLASKGAHVVFTSRDNETAEKVVQEAKARGASAMACHFDQEDPSTWGAMLDAVHENYRRLDILVNNAFYRLPFPRDRLLETSYPRLQKYITANLTNVLALTLQSFPYLKKNKGSVLNIGSAGVKRRLLVIGSSLYVIVKGALNELTRTLAANWAKDGVRVNQINPGFVITDTFKRSFSKEQIDIIVKEFERAHPIGRLGRPRDISELAAFILSGKASWMTGSILNIDGGASVQGMPIDLNGIA